MNKNINYVWNWETVRDFCGSLYNDIFSDIDFNISDPSDDVRMVYYLPEAVNDVVKIYHHRFAEAADASANSNIEFLKEKFLKELEGAIPLDSNLWKTDKYSIVYEIYNRIFVKYPIMMKVVKCYYMTDIYKAKRYIINHVKDEEAKKILLKAISGHRVVERYIDKDIFDMPFFFM